MKKSIVLLIVLSSAAAAVYAGSTITNQWQTVTGSGGSTAFGDYVSDAAALNTAYRYFIEVPPGLPRLDVDIFDADIGLGGTNEANAGRDRVRGTFNTTATYSLIGPDGVARRTLFNTGTATLPAGSDNAWTSFFSSTGDTVRDEFATAAYGNNDGTLNWSGDWIEANDDGSATGGLIQVTGGELRIRDDNKRGTSAIARDADLTGWTTATLSFNFSTQNVQATDQMRVQVSRDGGVNWTTLETFTGGFGNSSRTYDISSFISANTRIQFIEVSGYTGTDSFFVDNVQIKDSAIRNGHWEVRVDQSSASTAGDDINAFGLRAHDGVAGAGGIELPVYADSFVAVGVNPPASNTQSRAYTLYPYVTSGCSCSHNDFDFDSNSGTVGSMSYTSRGGQFTQTYGSASLSGNNVWARSTFSGWTSDTASSNYGIWQLAATISSYLVTGTPNGNYAALYDSSYAAAANPPTANPQSNALRIYFPTDAGTAPVKPYLEQTLTFRQGANPPAVGVSSRYKVTVKMTNPASSAITFSAANLVTANVPGGGAVYGGNAAVGQGSITAQPAVGGTGNITWNPGTLAAGASAILSYDVVVTPTAAGQRIPVTATPASGNGTRARYVDETGNATQARALFTFGPLCELAVTPGLITEVLLSSFNASVHGGATLVTWETASEAGTVGFNLYRSEAGGALTQVNRSLLTANPGAPQGGRYRFVDTGNDDPQPAYVLEEIMASGRTLRYGPFTSTASAGSEPLPAGDFDHEPRHDDRQPPPVSHGRKVKADAVMVGVRQTGLTRVSAADLAAILGMPQPAVEAAIKTGRISITDTGNAVAWTPSTGNTSLVFFGEAPDSIFSNDRVYRVALDRGTPMAVVDVSPAPERPTTFTATQQFEKDSFAATVLPLDPDSDYWFWDSVVAGFAGYSKKTFTIDVPAMATADNAALQVRLQGAMAAFAHRAHVSLNGTLLGDLVWSSLDSASVELSVPSGVLRDGANVVTVEGVLSPGEPYDVFYVDGFALRYTRVAVAREGRLEMTAVPGSTVTATGLDAAATALDITNRRQPILLRGGGSSFTVPAGAQVLYFSDPASIAAPDFVRGSAAPSLRDRRNAADYLVITDDATRAGADALASLRAQEGLQTLVVDLDDVYDEFSGGNATPHAIHDFLAATRGWSKPPRYVVLAGTGTLDYRGIATDPGLIPPLMARTANGLFASDTLFADFDGDGLPDLALGRIPVRSNAELVDYVAKLDAAARAAAGGAVFAADAVDRGANFKNESLLVESSLDRRPLTHVFVDDLGAAGARTSFLAAWNGGPGLVSWIGHGGVDRLSNTSLLTVADAPSLTTASGRLPVFVAMTCTINRFEIGSVEALGTSLTRAANAGALAVWSSSGLSAYNDATQLERTFMRLASNADGTRLGDLIVQSLAANSALSETSTVYLLLGDPAIKVTLPAAIPGAGDPPGAPE